MPNCTNSSRQGLLGICAIGGESRGEMDTKTLVEEEKGGEGGGGTEGTSLLEKGREKEMNERLSRSQLDFPHPRKRAKHTWAKNDVTKRRPWRIKRVFWGEIHLHNWKRLNQPGERREKESPSEKRKGRNAPRAFSDQEDKDEESTGDK